MNSLDQQNQFYIEFERFMNMASMSAPRSLPQNVIESFGILHSYMQSLSDEIAQAHAYVNQREQQTQDHVHPIKEPIPEMMVPVHVPITRAIDEIVIKTQYIIDSEPEINRSNSYLLHSIITDLRGMQVALVENDIIQKEKESR